MAATATESTIRGSDNIGLIRKKHVDMPATPAAYVMPRRTTGNERNSFLVGKKLQKEIMEAFDAYGSFLDRQRMGGMVLCLRDQDWHECPDNHEGRLHKAEFCGNRLCPICVKRRAMLAKEKYRPVLVNALSGAYSDDRQLVALFVTLTWPSLRNIVEDDVSRMWGDLAKLKRQAWWKRRVAGEVWSLEWTFSPVFGHHPHAHGVVLVDRALYDAAQEAFKQAHTGLPNMPRDEYRKWAARWWADNGPMPKPALSQAWEKLTGAPVVNAKLIRPRSKEWGNQSAMDAALDEVLKYPMKQTDYLEDRPLRKEERAGLEATMGELIDRREAIVELWKAIRGRRLSDTRGCVRGRLKQAMKEVEEAKSEELRRMDIDEIKAHASHCSHCAKEYVERTYQFQRRGDRLGFYVVAEAPYGTHQPEYDNQARRLLREEFDRQTLRHVANAVVKPWLKRVKERGSYGRKIYR